MDLKIKIYKNGKKSDPSNYRPISVLSLINKVFEKILHKRLYNYLTKFNILYKYQFGFREGHSTTQALDEITDRFRLAIDKQELTCGIFIDLTKALDTVDHNILLQKCSIMVSEEMFKSYFKAIFQTGNNL